MLKKIRLQFYVGPSTNPDLVDLNMLFDTG